MSAPPTFSPRSDWSAPSAVENSARSCERAKRPGSRVEREVAPLRDEQHSQGRQEDTYTTNRVR